MENREAIEILQFHTEIADPEFKDALNLAISALEFKERWMHHVRNRNGYCAWVRWRKNHNSR